MKKMPNEFGHCPFSCNFLLKMRLTVLAFLVATMTTLASNTFAQNTTVSIKMDNSTIEDVLKAIENKSEFHFFYNEIIDVDQKISVDFDNTAISEILDKIFDGRGISFKTIGHQIILTPEIKAESQAQQTTTVKGRVTDSSGQPLPGVTIIVKGTRIGVFSGENGEYVLNNIQSDAILLFSFIGMASLEIPVKDQTSIDVIMKQETFSIGEVVVVGYGTALKKDVVGAVDQIKSGSIEERPVSNVSQALQGASANLVIQQRSANPTNNTININIRGISTMNNNDPLIVIDGLITEIGSLNKLNPSDIENISVLKDAGSAAIYGSRSSNGVILVTTKKGSKNGKPVISFNLMSGIEKPHVLYSPVKGYENAILRNQALLNGESSPIYTPEEIRDLKANGDGKWFLDQILRNALQQNYDISMSGGNANSLYRVSAGYFNQESNIVGGYGVERYNFRTNLVNEYDRFKLTSTMSFNRTMQREPNVDYSTLIVDGGRIPTYYYYKMKASNGNYLVNDVLTEYNPLGLLEAGGAQKKDLDNFIGGLNIEYKIFNGLTAKGLVGFDLSADHRYIRTKEVPFYSDEDATVPSSYAFSDRSTEDFNYKEYTLNTQFMLDYDHTFNKANHITVLLGVSNESFTSEGNELIKEYTDPDLGIPDSDTKISTDSYNTLEATMRRSIYSVFGRAGYSYNDKYYAQLSFRYDGSSKFSKDYRWGFFPSLSAGWRISDESFMSSYKEKIGDLKIRGSYGILGNQNVDDFSYFTTYYLSGNAYGFNNSAVSGAGFSYGNLELQWEKSTTFNIGVDASLFDNKLLVSADFYNKETSGILLTPTVPSTFGGSVATENAGKMRNQGWELTLNYRVTTGKFKHDIIFNLANSKNKVVDYGGEEEISGADQMLWITRERLALKSYYGYKVDGYFKDEDDIAQSALPVGSNVKPGDVKYKDIHKDGVIDEEDRTVLGNAFPNFTFGLTYNLSWKSFDCNMLIQGVGKRDMFLRGELVEPFHSNYSYVMYKHQLDFWTPVNTDARWPRLSSPGSASNTNNYQKSSDLYMFNAAYVRLKDIQIGYTIPGNITQKAGISKIRIYVNAQNLLTLTRNSFIDPESSEFDQNMGSNGANSGRNYPTPIYYGGGLNVEF
jgi:TonB-linked SusC/RagA family outer membrane protein